MGLRDLISGAVAGAAGRIARIDEGLLSERAMRQVRREHDEWANTVKAGVVYYTALPALGQDLVRAGHISRVVHGSYVFGKRAAWGPLTGQWIVADGGTTSWGLWRQYGPLTTTVQWTQRDQDRLDAELDAAAERGMGAAVLDRLYASPEYRALTDRVGRDYPATVAALAA